MDLSWLVVMGFNTTLTAKFISWWPETHMSFLAFSHQYLHNFIFPQPPITFLTCFCRSERRKYARKKICLNQGSNSQPPGHESNTLTNEPSSRGPMDLTQYGAQQISEYEIDHRSVSLLRQLGISKSDWTCLGIFFRFGG